MKHVTIKARKTIRKTILTLGFASLFVFSLFPSAVRAQSKDKTEPVAIRYIGTVDELPMFEVEFDNKKGETYRISITDASGETLYTEKSSEKKFSRKFKLESPELFESQLTLTISTGNQKQKYAINSNTRTVQDYVITKL